jgi:hypothetical protein
MSHNRGYYSLIQFCPDSSRLEGVNVGVLLYSINEKRLEVLISQSNQRIRRFFGNQDWNLVNRAKLSIENQLRSQQFLDINELESFISRRANIIQLTQPRPIAISDLAKDTKDLHERLVGREPIERRRRIDGYLTDKFLAAGVVGLVRKSVNIELPNLKKSIRVPYGYQNGRFNLISPVQFDLEFDGVLAKTGKSAIEGQLLYKSRHAEFGDMRLLVIARFPKQVESETREFVRKTFEEHSVQLHTFDDLGPLVADIRRSAELHSTT